jgi:uncharacterized membrane protein
MDCDYSSTTLLIRAEHVTTRLPPCPGDDATAIGMNNDNLAVTIVLRVAIITTSLAGIVAMFAVLVSGPSRQTATYYNAQMYPSVAGKLGLAFVIIMWTSIVLSFLCYMSWRVRRSTAGAASPARFATPPGGPPAPNSRRHAEYD